MPALLPALVVLAALAPGAAHAYIDPGTGSLLLQGILGAIAAGMVAISFYWQRLKDFVSGRSRRPAQDATSERTGASGPTSPPER
jgi:hypothetical protein